jgi:hypothetical protein
LYSSFERGQKLLAKFNISYLRSKTRRPLSETLVDSRSLLFSKALKTMAKTANNIEELKKSKFRVP